MSLNDQVNALMTTAQQLAEQARSNPELADRLLANPGETIATAAGQAIPAGILVGATRDADGAIKFSAGTDPDYDGELDDALLEAVPSGGMGLVGLFDLSGPVTKK